MINFTDAGLKPLVENDTPICCLMTCPGCEIGGNLIRSQAAVTLKANGRGQDGIDDYMWLLTTFFEVEYTQPDRKGILITTSTPCFTMPMEDGWWNEIR